MSHIAPPDEVVTITHEEYRRDMAKYVGMASTRHFVVVVDEDGTPGIILGRGHPQPETDEEKAEARKWLDEFFASLESEEEGGEQLGEENAECR